MSRRARRKPRRSSRSCANVVIMCSCGRRADRRSPPLVDSSADWPRRRKNMRRRSITLRPASCAWLLIPASLWACNKTETAPVALEKVADKSQAVVTAASEKLEGDCDDEDNHHGHAKAAT